MSHFQSAEQESTSYRGNPLTALLRAERKTCKGCIWAIGKIDVFENSLCAKDKLMTERCPKYIDSTAYRNDWRNRNALH